jgi:4a-hydroxytetrahydrobiopterin dehydratase
MSQPLPDPNQLLNQKCVPCEGGTEPLAELEEDAYLSSVEPFRIERATVHRLVREVTFKDFQEVLSAVNKIGEIAEADGHHPNLYLHEYKHLRIELSTYAIKGLSMNDFILAAKINELLKSYEI